MTIHQLRILCWSISNQASEISKLFLHIAICKLLTKEFVNNILVKTICKLFLQIAMCKLFLHIEICKPLTICKQFVSIICYIKSNSLFWYQEAVMQYQTYRNSRTAHNNTHIGKYPHTTPSTSLVCWLEDNPDVRSSASCSLATASSVDKNYQH